MNLDFVFVVFIVICCLLLNSEEVDFFRICFIEQEFLYLRKSDRFFFVIEL